MRKQISWVLVVTLALPLVLLFLGQAAPGTKPTSETSEPPAQSSGAETAAAMLTVLNPAGQLQEMGLEEYLEGVVRAEMPASFPEEALKAQAVVARTYTARRMASGKHGQAAVCMDPGCCQDYITAGEYLDAGGTESDVDKIRAAVATTAGQVLTYEGALIDATYFSCSGGQTEDAVAVWGQDVPYLQSVESPGEEDAPRYMDTVSFTPAQFRALTGCAMGDDPAEWFGEVTYTEGGGVATMEICGETFTGTQLRSLLGLRSTDFSIRFGDGGIVITTRGFGHRVGMSQYGARAMALEGVGYEEILTHYYTGAVLENRDLG